MAISTVSITAFSIFIAIIIYLIQKHDTERNRIKKDLKSFNSKLKKFDDLNSNASWFATPPPELTWEQGCDQMLERYWNAKRDPSKWHAAFEWLAYLQYFMYQGFFTCIESFKENFSISEFENWWDNFHTFSDKIEKVHAFITPGIPEEISRKYKTKIIKSQPEWKSKQEQSISNYYEGFFPQFLALQKQSNTIQTRIGEFKKDVFNAMLESKTSIYSITFFVSY